MNDEIIALIQEIGNGKRSQIDARDKEGSEMLKGLEGKSLQQLNEALDSLGDVDAYLEEIAALMEFSDGSTAEEIEMQKKFAEFAKLMSDFVPDMLTAFAVLTDKLELEEEYSGITDRILEILAERENIPDGIDKNTIKKFLAEGGDIKDIISQAKTTIAESTTEPKSDALPEPETDDIIVQKSSRLIPEAK